MFVRSSCERARIRVGLGWWAVKWWRALALICTTKLFADWCHMSAFSMLVVALMKKARLWLCHLFEHNCSSHYFAARTEHHFSSLILEEIARHGLQPVTRLYRRNSIRGESIQTLKEEAPLARERPLEWVKRAECALFYTTSVALVVLRWGIGKQWWWESGFGHSTECGQVSDRHRPDQTGNETSYQTSCVTDHVALNRPG